MSAKTYQLSASLPKVVPMTNEQYRIHRSLGSAEKRLIHAYVWGEDPAKIERIEATVRRLTTAWRKACSKVGAQR